MFDGLSYEAALDRIRLTRQLQVVFIVTEQASRKGQWLTLGELAAACGAPESSISARLRDLRKPRFGSHVVEKRRRGEGRRGLWEYKVLFRNQEAIQ